MIATLTMISKKYWPGLAAIFCPGLLFASTLRPFTATYSATMHGLPIGKITRSLAIKNGRYQFISDMKSTLPFTDLEIHVESRGNWTTAGPQPLDYEYHYQHFHKTKTITTHFDWTKHIARTNKHGKQEEVTISSGDQDKLSYQLAVRNDLLSQRKRLTYRIADGHSIDTYIFNQTGTATIKTPSGNLKTIKMQRSNTGPNSENIIFWLSPKDNYSIAKIIDIDNGKTKFAGVLKSYQSHW